MKNYLDHRQLAEEMEIFFIHEQIGSGLPVWLPAGMAVREALESYMKRLEHQAGYLRVSSPHIAKQSLYEASGHLRVYKENMFPPMSWPEDKSLYYLRPMNCPHHHRIFSHGLRSYRELPLRIAEYGQVYRYENSGSLKGLSRVRGLCQNDAHIYVDPRQLKRELLSVLELHERCYRDLGLRGYRYRLSKCDPQRMENFDGPLALWQKAEQNLRDCLREKNLPYFEQEGEAAFYGPKIDVQMPIAGGEEESISSIQVDFNSAEKFDLKFVSPSGDLERPWIIHRAPLGSHERFVALLLEYYQGHLPGWLSPVQVSLVPVEEKHQSFALELAQKLKIKHLRAEVDLSQGRLSKRILFSHKKRPFTRIVIGEKEIESGDCFLEKREEKRKLSFSELPDFLARELAPPI